jgi:hypothetical protein
MKNLADPHETAVWLDLDHTVENLTVQSLEQFESQEFSDFIDFRSYAVMKERTAD